MDFIYNLAILLVLLFLFNVLTSFILHHSNQPLLFRYNLIFFSLVTIQMSSSIVIKYFNLPLIYEPLIIISILSWPLNYFGLKIIHQVNDLTFKPFVYNLICGISLLVSLSLVPFVSFRVLGICAVTFTILPALFITVRILLSYRSNPILTLPLGLIYLFTLVHMADYPFLRPIEIVAPLGFSIYTSLYIGFSIFLPSTLIVRANREYSSNLEKNQFQLHELVIEKNEQLTQINGQLDEYSQKAGKTELVTGVLHNVGNVLNSINLSSDIIRDKIKSSMSKRLLETVELMNTNLPSNPQYLVNDPKGKLIPKYLIEITKSIQSKNIDVQNELRNLQENTDHIKNIISIQQSVAGLKGPVENVSLDMMINQAITINLSSLNKYDIHIEKLYKNDIHVHTDKFKVLQILINLISNAKHALYNADHRVIQIGLDLLSNQQVSMHVSDSGLGIPKDQLVKVFQYGFTTKQKGHGFGLHSSLNLAKDLGGSLDVGSEGTGKGAIFTLTLPLTHSQSA